MLDKSETRQKFKEIRKNISDRVAKERIVFERLFARFGDSKSVFCYQSFGSEVSTVDIINEFLVRGAKVFIPEIDGKKMMLKNIKTGEYSDKPCKLSIVPLLAFDGDCCRIGYGKGYYDRYLSVNATVSVGIAFAEQYCENLPKNEQDIPLSCIITSGIIVERTKK